MHLSQPSENNRKISAVILTKNSAKTLGKTLATLQNFPEVIILDSGSTDETVVIAGRFSNVKISHHPFCGFGPMHNKAAQLTTSDWIFSIDSDEELTPELSDELLKRELHENEVYSVYRRNFLNGKEIKWCSGWHPDRVRRLYNKKRTQFSSDLVHEKIELADGMKESILNHSLIHTPYGEISDFLYKMQHYSSLFAQQHAATKSSSITGAVFRGLFAFIKSYFIKRGFLGGKEGFFISLYNAHTTFYKYLKLAERRNKTVL